MRSNVDVETIPTYPLTWPTGHARAREQKAPHFGTKTPSNGGRRSLSIAEARIQLLEEVRRLQGGKLIPPVRISSNLHLTNAGMPRSGQAQPHDTGVAVYFYRYEKPYVLACDHWTTVQANMQAITMHIAALRGQERWGVGTLEQAMQGYELPNTTTATEWWTILNIPRTSTLEACEQRYRKLALEKHPDRNGDEDEFKAINNAINQARTEKS